MNFITKYIDPFYFISALAVGLLLCYLIAPTPEVIIKYPTPDTADDLIYKDDSDNCYKFESTEVECPANVSKIHKIPVQVSLKA